jgi:chemotaxis protein methyltransferase CheR
VSKQLQSGAGTLVLSDQDFETFREFFYRQTGMYFEESKRYFVDKRLIDRMEATRCRTVREYLALVRLQPSGAERQALTNALTVNETYFFRDLVQIECLTHRMLPEIIAGKKGSKTLKIWSSPCSSGEEPYSIAIHLLEHWPQVDDYEIEIFGTDIDSQIIEQARRGIFSPRSVQNLPKNLIGRYFTPLAGGHYQISAELRDSIAFTQVNIVNAAQTRGFRDFDIIFSRNMLIYFDNKSRRIAAEAFYDALKPGGFICLAPTEPMSHISSQFRHRTFPGVTAYQRPL